MCGSCQKNQLEDTTVPPMRNAEIPSQSGDMEDSDVVTTQARSMHSFQNSSPSQNGSRPAMTGNSRHTSNAQEGDGQSESTFSTGTLQQTCENPNVGHFRCYSILYGSGHPACPQSQPRPFKTDKEVILKHHVEKRFASPCQSVRFPCQGNNSLSMTKTTCACSSVLPSNRVTPQEMREFWKRKSNTQLQYVQKNPEAVNRACLPTRRPPERKAVPESGCSNISILKRKAVSSTNRPTIQRDTNKEAERTSDSKKDDYNESPLSVGRKGIFITTVALKVKNESNAQFKNAYNSPYHQHDTNSCQFKYRQSIPAKDLKTISKINETRASHEETLSHTTRKHKQVKTPSPGIVDIQQMIVSINLQKTDRQAFGVDLHLQSLREEVTEDRRRGTVSSCTEMHVSHSPTLGLHNFKCDTEDSLQSKFYEPNKGMDNVSLGEKNSYIDNDGRSSIHAKTSQNMRLMSDSLGSFSDIGFNLPPVTAIISEDCVSMDSFSEIFEGCSPAKDLTLEQKNVYKLAWANSWLFDISSGHQNVGCAQDNSATHPSSGSCPEQDSLPCNNNLERIYSPPDLVKDLKLPNISSRNNLTGKAAIESEVNGTHYPRLDCVVNEELGMNQDNSLKHIFMSQTSLGLFKSPSSSAKREEAQLCANSTQKQTTDFSRQTLLSPVLQKNPKSVLPLEYCQDRLAQRVSTPISSLYSRHGSYVAAGCGKRDSDGSYIWDDSFLFLDLSGRSETHEAHTGRSYGDGFKSTSPGKEELCHENQYVGTSFECRARKKTCISNDSKQRHNGFVETFDNSFYMTHGTEKQGPGKIDATTESKSVQFLQLSPSSLLLPRRV